VCQAEYSTPPPSPGELLALVRGDGGASLAALLQPGTLVVAYDVPLNEAALARAGPHHGLTLVHFSA
jgi:hypothetical protein